MSCIRRKRGTGLIFCARGHFPSLYRLIWSFCKSKSLDTHYIVCPVIIFSVVILICIICSYITSFSNLDSKLELTKIGVIG